MGGTDALTTGLSLLSLVGLHAADTNAQGRTCEQASEPSYVNDKMLSNMGCHNA